MPPKKNHRLFTLQHHDDLESINRQTDDDFFEEAFSNTQGSALLSNRSYVGSVIPKKRLYIAMIVVIGVLLLFVAKTSALQIFQGEEYRAQAENNRIAERILPAQRGIIYDRNGVILAQNDPLFQITSSKAELPSDELSLDLLFTKLSEITGVEKKDIEDPFNETENKREEILLVEDLDYNTAMLFAGSRSDFPGMHLEVGSRRSYITDAVPSLSHVLGYTAIISPEEYKMVSDQGYRRFDQIGKQGIESQYEEILRGSFGEEILEVDALGRTKRIVSKRDPIDGENLYLSIDADFQSYIEEIVVARLEGTAAEKASVIAMNPQNGEILALVSWPAYDANAFTKGIDVESYNALLIDENRPLFPRAHSGEFPAGSTIKPVYAAAALAEGLITPSTSFLSVGGLRVGVWFFPDWRAGGHGVTNVYHAIADSVNTFFYMIGGGYNEFTGLGVTTLMDYAALYGFGTESGIDIPSEADGFLPSKDWKLETIGEQWYIGDTYNTSIGQGYFLTTPLQITRATAVFANGGNLVTPKLNTAKETESVNIVDAETTQVIKDAMRQTVTYGSASSMQSVSVPVAGKTGTAQWSNEKSPHSWFTGFAPFDEPEIVITVLVEEGSDASLAIPISREALNWWFANQ
jgi:penicillin-binding protein 2